MTKRRTIKICEDYKPSSWQFNLNYLKMNSLLYKDDELKSEAKDKNMQFLNDVI